MTSIHECTPFITLYLGSIGVDRVISEPCYKGTILQMNYRKMTISWSFSYNSFVKFHGKKIGSHNMTELYPNLCYNEVCYEGTALFFYVCKQQRLVRLHICAGLSEPSLFAFLMSTKISLSDS